MSKPTLPTTVTGVRASNRSGSATQENGQHVPARIERERDPKQDRRSSGDRRQEDRRKADADIMLDTRSGEDRRKGPRRQTDRKPPDDDGPSLGIDVFV
ncbi:MAG: hypothetical protein GC138_05130 [Gammaproteobacteria bacterium]|nr:hypothetical protein [Gammaproteobacteria bacterium]